MVLLKIKVKVLDLFAFYPITVMVPVDLSSEGYDCRSVDAVNENDTMEF